MIPALELTLVLLVLAGLGAWGIVTGVRASRTEPPVSVTPQQLAALAQPYRGLLGEAASIQHDVSEEIRGAPPPLRRELRELSTRVARLVKRALPRAQLGTRLSAYLLELDAAEPQYEKTRSAAAEIEHDLTQFLETLKTIRAKVYQVITDAAALTADRQLRVDLQDALIEIGSLEEAFSAARSDSG